MLIKIITQGKIVCESAENVTADRIGQKAFGLLSVPEEWALPFVCIDTSVFEAYTKAINNFQKYKVIQTIVRRIISELSYLGVEENEQIFIRSSGVEEGILERGKYESKKSSVYDICTVLTELFCYIDNEFEKAPRMAFVVQRFVPYICCGHLSNERRFTKDKRDWVYEYTTINPTEVYSDRISIRNWRKQPNAENIERLLCNNAPEIGKSLRTIAELYTGQKKAVHFEFLWNGTHIYVVQADQELNDINNGFDPTEIDVSVKIESLSSFKVLRNATEEDNKYSKVENTLIYKQAGLRTVPIYILDGEDNLRQLRNKNLSAALEDDLRAISQNSIVVRTDIAYATKEQKQLLARSNEIRTYDDLIQWLFNQSELLKMNSEIAFLFHVFVPAVSAAFVNAGPTKRLVEIEALWGLPEGLYYNAHDKFWVDTKLIDADVLTKNDVEILKDKLAYKEYYIAPDSEGKWVAKKTAVPYDWARCISKESIKQIAVESRKIAVITGQNISIMWFIGIDEQYYGTPNLVWHHEVYSDSSYTTSDYKKKYFYETETVIRNYKDYQNFLENPNVKEIRLRPVDDALLRNKDFLKDVGEAAKKKNVSIILEGAVLAHPLYQLCRTGARVLTQELQASYSESVSFNKLVRDRIPEKIVSNGESVTCFALSDDALLRALMEKAVEEAIEIGMASIENMLIEELGDEYEVINTIIEVLDKVDRLSPLLYKHNRIVDDSYFEIRKVIYIKCDLCNSVYYSNNNVGEYGTLGIGVSYEKSNLQIEMHFSKNPSKKISDKCLPETKCLFIEKANQIKKCAFSLTCYKRKSDVKKQCLKILELIHDIRQNDLNISINEFISIVSNKKIRRGGFNAGYMLSSSSIVDLQESNTGDQLELDIGENGYSKVSTLPFQVTKNADFLDKGNGELVLRLSLPLCFNNYQVEFDSNTVKKYVGDNKKIVVDLFRKNNMLEIEVDELIDKYEYMQYQLEL